MVNCADAVNETTAIPQINNNLFILLNFMFNMYSGAKIIKRYGINSNNPAILYEVAGLLYETSSYLSYKHVKLGCC